ncbi:MAG: HNH endonuclease signature motif containing protein, partial [Atribacterota bacterium]|nr:HNH endonuclease signature motif containing protein [Atribacterota bacterium]
MERATKEKRGKENMSIYRSIHVSYWQDSFILKLTPEQKFFYLYLMTNSKTTQCGIYEISKQIMCFETGYNSETIDKLLKIFIDYGKIKYCEETDEVFIINWLKHNPSKSPKVMACIKAEILKIKCKEFRDELINKLKNFGEIDTELYRTANKAEISKTTAFRVFERDKNKCVRCGATDGLTIDHIFPRKMGGTNALTNLRVLCRSCNSKRITSGTGFLEDLKKDGLTLDDFDRLTNPSDTVSKTSDTVSKSCRNNNNNNNNNKNKNKNNNKKNIYNNQENSSSVVKTTIPSNAEIENMEN